MNTNTAELIGEQEAAIQARVSISTLARFAEAGYFQVVFRGEERCYPKQALSSLFGVTFEPVEPPIVAAKKGNVISFPNPETLAAKAAVEESSTETEVTAKPSTLATPEPPPSDQQPQSMAFANTADSPGLQSETESTSFKTILKMHADILQRQENEIQDLRSEREWLKKRIEKLEEKAERDQILLLSETQTVKQLIQISSQKKSLMRQSLEWLGVIPQEIPEHDNLLPGKIVDTENAKSGS